MASLALSATDLEDFVEQGFVRLDDAFPAALAEEACSILWRNMGLSADDPTRWSQPVVRLGMYIDPPFVEAANTSRLHAAYDQLAGQGRWVPPRAMGTFPVRFPSEADPGDTGWHIDVSFDYEKPNFLDWRANIASRGRALLMLFLFSDVGDDDAPTRIRIGSHKDIARRLAPAGEAGLTLGDLASTGFAESAHCAEALATGAAGTVYLCHPFLVHSAQPHRGTGPRFMAQPPLLPAEPIRLDREDGAYSPVEQAIRAALK